jgi:hypothetical protein
MGYKMDIKQFEKAANIYKRVKEMDSEIIRVESLAAQVAEGSQGITIEMNVEKEPIVVDPSTEKFDGIMSYITFDFGFGTAKASTSTKPNYQTLREWISEPFALRILALILEDKKTKRDILINQLRDISEKIKSTH